MKEHNHQNKKVIFKMEENICKSYTTKGLISRICEELSELNKNNKNIISHLKVAKGLE